MADRGLNESFEHMSNRFWSKVNKTKSCWLWTAGCDLDGYGLFKYYRKTRRAAQISMIITYGSIPKNCWVLHTCDNPKCVNPDHLYFGSPSMNSLDREKRNRGRDLKGSQNGFNKLVEKQVLEIRSLYKIMTNKIIALKYKITPSLVSLIMNRKVWKHI